MTEVPTGFDSPERAALVAAIARHDAALADLAQIREAAGRAPATWKAEDSVEAAQAALDEARAGEASFFVRELMGDAAGGNPVAAAERALLDAQAALDRARKVRDLAESQERTAAQTVDNPPLQHRHRACRAVLQGEPAVAARGARCRPKAASRAGH